MISTNLQLLVNLFFATSYYKSTPSVREKGLNLFQFLHHQIDNVKQTTISTIQCFIHDRPWEIENKTILWTLKPNLLFPNFTDIIWQHPTLFSVVTEVYQSAFKCFPSKILFVNHFLVICQIISQFTDKKLLKWMIKNSNICWIQQTVVIRC